MRTRHGNPLYCPAKSVNFFTTVANVGSNKSSPSLRQIRIIRTIAACSTPMYYSRRSGSYLAKRMHVSHNIVPPTLFFHLGDFEVGICHCDVGFNLGDDFIADVETELFFGFGESNPVLAPCWGSGAGGEGEHFFAWRRVSGVN